MNKDYFSRIVALYEAARMAGTEEVIPQEQIADTGSDVAPNVEQVPVNGEEIPPENVDPNMMVAQPVQPDASAIMEKQKFVKLFGLFEDLLNYGNSFLDALKVIDSNLLDTETTEKSKMYSNNIRQLVEKVNEYIKNVLSSEDYTKALYTYVLFRTEFVSNIRGFRSICKVDQQEEKK